MIVKKKKYNYNRILKAAALQKIIFERSRDCIALNMI